MSKYSYHNNSNKFNKGTNVVPRKTTVLSVAETYMSVPHESHC